MRKGLVDSMVLMHYDNGHEEAIDWWERMLEDGWDLSVSVVTLMERLKGIAGISGRRDRILTAFTERIKRMRKDGKITQVYQITKTISKRAYQLICDYCERYTPPSKGRAIEGLICDMIIAATAIEHKLVLFTHNTQDFKWICGLEVEKPEYEILD